MGAKANSRTAQHQQQSDLKSDDDIPACQSCRRKKARCSREQPCSQCVRFGTTCIYDDKKLKPGLRAGVVDNLSRRIETLENMFLGQEILWKQMWETLHPDTKFPGVATDTPDDLDSSRESNGIYERQETLRRSLLQVAATHEDRSKDTRIESSVPPAKRQRIDPSPAPSIEHENHGISAVDVIESDLMGQLVEFYFDNFHHWIPILHVRRFRHQIQSAEGRGKVIHILYAVIAACIRFVHDPRFTDEGRKARVAESCRQKVVLCSMESFSVENLQALVIIAFDTIARGRGPSSWSIVGSMARTVEQLQLSMEEDSVHERSQPGETLIRRMAFLKPSTCWREAEERRRVFWTVFLMDRFCSVSTGWNVSLTTADVKRRLPCEGALWQREDEVRAPYFGVSDAHSMAKQRSLLLDRRFDADPVELDSIGGFAYCIEATESLALVSNFFVHQPLDVRNAEEAQIWLMRFKELDLRLVQWKLFLPSKWREASTLNADGIMDSNLTLAHITHNTVVILLHQAIAYPPHHWKSSPVKLPSSSSAETCIEAAFEISTIGQQFLLFSPMLTNPQFSFCLFIAGRMLLTHARYNATPIPLALGVLIASLFEISARWAGPRDIAGPEKENLATVFAKRLVQARDNILPTARGNLDIRQPVYSEATEEGILTGDRTTENPISVTLSPHQASSSSTAAMDHFRGIQADTQFTEFHETNSESSLTLAFPPLPLSFQQNFAPFADPDPFNLHLDPGECAPSPITSTVVNQAQNPTGWNSIHASFHPHALDSYSNRSAGSGDDLSPGQRISRFGTGE
ncbi:fungal-specific transcription factor domain-containing protein [Aspergillus cavernicola]|uniref:Fungal-specific transcription factor domain-containing protein n=1 Tax=Aspergillus cavernicola TaxID=176166 RepID=A0ABR4HGC3_9EURO